MRVDFEHRLSTEEYVVAIGMIDLADGNRWIDLGQSSVLVLAAGLYAPMRAPDRIARQCGTTATQMPVTSGRVLDVETRQMRTLPVPDRHDQPRRKSRPVLEDYSRNTGTSKPSFSDMRQSPTCTKKIAPWKR